MPAEKKRLVLPYMFERALRHIRESARCADRLCSLLKSSRTVSNTASRCSASFSKFASASFSMARSASASRCVGISFKRSLEMAHAGSASGFDIELRARHSRHFGEDFVAGHQLAIQVDLLLLLECIFSMQIGGGLFVRHDTRALSDDCAQTDEYRYQRSRLTCFIGQDWSRPPGAFCLRFESAWEDKLR